MRARSFFRPTTSPTFTPAFTLVELIIVIIVIAILAAITIVAYSGITSRAVVASLTSDLENANKQLVYYLGTNTGYPTAIDCSSSPAANTICLKGSMINGTPTTYQYTVNNTVTPQTYYVTATSGSISYYIGTSVGVATSGSCSITNLIANPSFETDGSLWWKNAGAGGVGSTTRLTNGGVSGTGYLRMSWTTAPTGVVQLGMGPTQMQIQAGSTYNFSISIRQTWVGNETLNLRWFDSGGSTLGSASTANTAMVPGQWVRIASSSVAPVGSAAVNFYTQSSNTPTTVDTLDIDAAMFSLGSSANYADGNTTNWVWNGTPNLSTSTGPQV